MEGIELLSLAVFIIMGIIGTQMSKKRNMSKLGGFALGFLLGLIGLAIIALVGEKKEIQ
jgi:FtsH-binding integral membrane protein